MKIILLVFMSEIKIDFLFHRMNIKSSVFTRGGAMSENNTSGVHE